MSSNRKSSSKNVRSKNVRSKNVRSNNRSRSRSNNSSRSRNNKRIRSNKRSNKSSRRTNYINTYIKGPFEGFIKCHNLIEKKELHLFKEMMNSNPRSLRVLREIVPKPTIEQTERTRKIHNEFKNRYDNYKIHYKEIISRMTLIKSNNISESDLYRDRASYTKLIVDANESRIKLLELDPELHRQVTECSKSIHK